MIRMMTSLCMIMALMFLAAPASAQSNTAPIGTVIAAEGSGNVILRFGGDTNPIMLKSDDPIYTNDIIQSGPGARILILMLDDTRFTLGENSRLRIDSYVYNDEDPLVNRAAYSVLKGNFLYVSGKIAQRDNPDIKITTEYGTAVLRGTTIWGGMVDDEYGIFVDDGDIAFETTRGRIRVTKGEGTTIRSINSIPERPKLWDAAKVERAKSMIGLSNVDIVKERVLFHQQNHMALMAQHKQDTQAGRDKNIEVSKGQQSQRRIDIKDMKAPATTPAPTPARTLSPTAAQPVEKSVPPAPPTEDTAPKPDTEQKSETVPTPGPAAVKQDAPITDGFQLKAADEKPAADQQAPTTAEQPFPKPAQPANVNGADDLPADPAMRQEAIERMQLNGQPKPNGFESPAVESTVKNPL